MSEAGDQRLLQTYRAANAALDEAPGEQARAAILAAAARAAGSKPQAVHRSPRWRLPLAAAASLLIGTIAVMMATRVERPDSLPREASTIAAAPATAETSAREAAAPPASAEKAAQAPEAAAAPPKRERREVPAAALQPPAATAAQIAGRSGPGPAPLVARPQPGADAVATAKAEAEAGTGSAPAAAAAIASGATAARTVAPRAEADARAAVADAGTRPEDSPWRSAPGTWIERIVQLRAQGQHEQADAELALLRARHPELRLAPSVQRSPPGR